MSDDRREADLARAREVARSMHQRANVEIDRYYAREGHGDAAAIERVCDAVDALSPASGGADQEDADPFAALRALPEWQAFVSELDTYGPRSIADYFAGRFDNARSIFAASRALVEAIPGAPSTDPAPEPGEERDE